jgi:general secretion pathway protein G
MLSGRSIAMRSGERGLTLAELIVTITILTILMSAALPLVRFQVKRQKERELHYDLWMMRDAIDKYKDAADRGAFQTKVESQNYPPDLQTLVDGVDVQGKKLRFLRKIPTDPMTIPTPTPGAGRASSTCTPSRRERRSTEPSTRRGEMN